MELVTARYLAQLIAAVDAGAVCRWLKDGRIVEGTARHFVTDPDTFAFARADDKVEDTFVRFSGTFEWAIPTMDVLRMMEAGEFAAE